MLKKVLVATLLSSVCSFAYDYNLKPVNVSKDIWCFFGKLEAPSKENGGFMSNSCYIKAKDSYVLIDSGVGYDFAKQAYKAMEKIEKLPVSTIITTHIHDDHWLGNSFYKEKFNAKIYAPTLLNKEFNKNSQLRGVNVLDKNDQKNTKFIPADENINEEKTLKIGDKELIITPTKLKAHTSDDLFVFLPKEKVLFSGDLVMNGRVTSNRDGSVIGSLKALDMINAKKWDILIAGHGTNTSKTAIDESTKYFTLLKQRVIEAIQNEVSAEEISKVVKMEEFKNMGLYDELNAKNVFDAFRELEFYEEE